MYCAGIPAKMTKRSLSLFKLLFSRGCPHYKCIHLANLAAPVGYLDLMARAHNRHITHMNIAGNGGQSLRPDLWRVSWRHQRDIVVTQGISRVGFMLPVQFLIQIDIKLGIP